MTTTNTHMVLPITWLNLTITTSIVLLSAFYFIYGRENDRWMMLFNLIGSLFVLISFIVFLTDALLSDFMTRDQVSLLLIKPMIFYLNVLVLVNIIRLGRKIDAS
jgi:hypothetical protein